VTTNLPVDKLAIVWIILWNINSKNALVQCSRASAEMVTLAAPLLAVCQLEQSWEPSGIVEREFARGFD
jgi:hypothetical protein